MSNLSQYSIVQAWEYLEQRTNRVKEALANETDPNKAQPLEKELDALKNVCRTLGSVLDEAEDLRIALREIGVSEQQKKRLDAWEETRRRFPAGTCVRMRYETKMNTEPVSRDGNLVRIRFEPAKSDKPITEDVGHVLNVHLDGMLECVFEEYGFRRGHPNDVIRIK